MTYEAGCFENMVKKDTVKMNKNGAEKWGLDPFFNKKKTVPFFGQGNCMRTVPFLCTEKVSCPLF